MYKLVVFEQEGQLLDLFQNFKLALYANDNLLPSKPEDYFMGYPVKFFMVLKSDVVCSRACSFINPQLSYKGQQVGLIGFFESMNDPLASHLLLEGICSYFQTEGISYVIGPMNGDTWHTYRFKEESPAPPFLMEMHHKDYYIDLFMQSQFTKMATYTSTQFKKYEVNQEDLDKKTHNLQQQNISLRLLDFNHFEAELEILYDVCLKGFEDNFLYTPISLDEFKKLYLPVQTLLHPEFSMCLTNADNQIIGFILSVNNLVNPHQKSLILKSITVLPQYRSLGLGKHLIAKVHQRAFQQSYQDIIHAFMIEDNRSSKILEDKSTLLRTYYLFGKAI